jgi:hypothetical protein
METMTPFDQLKRRFPQLIPIPELRASVSIIQLALHYGYQPQPAKGKARPVFTHPHYQDTIIIKHPNRPSQQLYQRAGDFTDAGTIIDFIRYRLTTVFARFNRPNQHQLTSVTQVLYDYLQVDPSVSTTQLPPISTVDKPTSPPPFRLADFDIRPIEPTNYLLDRAIKPATWRTPEFAGKVWTQIAYYDQQARSSVSFATTQAQTQKVYRTFHNIAFPYYNSTSDEVSGLEIRNHGLKQHATGSDRSTSVFISNTPDKAARFYVMESVIDALSHCQLKHQQGDHSFEAVYFSTGGQLMPGQITTVLWHINRLEKTPDWQLYLSFDKDDSGWQYDLSFVQLLVAPYLPLSASPAVREAIIYALPILGKHHLIMMKLLECIRVPGQHTPSLSHGIPSISISKRDDQLLINVPTNSSSLSFFTAVLLEITGLSKRVFIYKSTLKDFNEDLSQN